MTDYGRGVEGFGGHPISHSRERPEVYDTSGNITKKIIPIERGRDDLLPIEGWAANMQLISYEPGRSADPVCLHDRFGRIIHQWPDGYIPDLAEVRALVLKVLSI